MLSDQSKISSPSRTYVAICYKGSFDGHYMRKFCLPATLAEVPAHAKALYVVHTIVSDGDPCVGESNVNNASKAEWYFMNVLDTSAGVEGTIAFEDFSDLAEEKVCACGHRHFRAVDECFSCEIRTNALAVR